MYDGIVEYWVGPSWPRPNSEQVKVIRNRFAFARANSARDFIFDTEM